MTSNPYLLTADAIAPMDPALPPVLFNAGIIIMGDLITAVGEISDLRRTHGELPTDHLAGLLLPGLINAHTHLELSHLSPEKLNASPPASFPQWVSSLMANRPAPEQQEAITREAFSAGLRQSLTHGVTTLGDITRNAPITRDQYLREAQTKPQPRIISYGEVVALGKMRHRLTELLDAATQYPATTNPSAPPTDHGPRTTDYESRLTAHGSRLTPGISPHAPYTVEGPALRACVQRAIIKRLPLCMHLAELADEAAFLRDFSGSLGRDWDVMQKMDILDFGIPLYAGGPIRWAQLHGLLVNGPRDFPVLLAHVNYCDDAELSQLSATTASVAYCPRTRHYFGHDAVAPHRYRDMLAAGINVCLATDSLASNPDLDVLKEAQLLHQRDALDPTAALEMITRRPAAALGLADLAGSISPGKSADLVLFPIEVSSDVAPRTLLSELLDRTPIPKGVWIAGEGVT